MNLYEEWINNYNQLLNIIYNNFLVISNKNRLHIINNQETFDNFCYMIYCNSRNIELKNTNLFDYVK
jgi:hypothetical protein